MPYADPAAALDGIRALTASEFEEIRRLARNKFGLDLKQGKEGLVSARLRKLIRQQNLSTFHELYERVVRDHSGEWLVALIDALATNHTSFLREPEHFELLRQFAGRWQGRGRISIWSAACSTGEEPYSIAFTLLEQFGLRRTPALEILATDISTRVLAAARNGVYSAESVRGLPRGWLGQYFVRDAANLGSHKVRPEVSSLIAFRRHNLIEPIPWQRQFPAIFCRNVMIYFDKQTQGRLVNRLADCLEPGGYLFVGHAESLTAVDHHLEYVKPAVYRKPVAGAGSPVPTGAPRERT